MKSNLKMRVTIVSDTHIDINHPFAKIPMFYLCRALKNSKKLQSDVFLIVGDTTSHGNRTNWNLTRSCFKKVKNCAENIIFALGNHDCWGDGDNAYETSIKEYYSACLDIIGNAPDKPYFSSVVNGYSLICLGNERESGCEAYISDNQLAWLESELKKSTEKGKPVFVFCHQSLNGRHGLPRTWEKEYNPNFPPEEGGVGEKSKEIEKILKSFKNVFYFSGHSHMGICGEKTMKEKGYSSFEFEDGVHLINLSSLACGNHCGETNKMCAGVVLDVYDDKVIIRPRDFLLGRYIKSVKIKDSKPYYEVKLL